MKAKMMFSVLTVAVMAWSCCGAVESAAAESEKAEKAKKVEYFPLFPKVEWEKLNWLQKTTASIACVPGCLFSSLANGYLWVKSW